MEKELVTPMDTSDPDASIPITIYGLRTGADLAPIPTTVSVPRSTPVSALWPLLNVTHPEVHSFSQFKNPPQTGFSNTHDNLSNLKLNCYYTHLTPTYKQWTSVPTEHESVTLVSGRPTDLEKRELSLDDPLVKYSNLLLRNGRPFSLSATVIPADEGAPDNTLLLSNIPEEEKENHDARRELDGEKNLGLTFHRTVRLPDDNRLHHLPSSLGMFPLFNVVTHADRLPEKIVKDGGVFMPMWQREAMWIRFDVTGGGSYAVRAAAGGINVVTGEKMKLLEEVDVMGGAGKQDWVILPQQPWLDGVCVEEGVVRQFVAMPLGGGYTIEGQKTGEEKHGGLQLEIIPLYETNLRSWFLKGNNTKTNPFDESKTPRELGYSAGNVLEAFVYPGQKHVLLPVTVADLCAHADWDADKGVYLKALYSDPGSSDVKVMPGQDSQLCGSRNAPRGRKLRYSYSAHQPNSATASTTLTTLPESTTGFSGEERSHVEELEHDEPGYTSAYIRVTNGTTSNSLPMQNEIGDMVHLKSAIRFSQPPPQGASLAEADEDTANLAPYICEPRSYAAAKLPSTWPPGEQQENAANEFYNSWSAPDPRCSFEASYDPRLGAKWQASAAGADYSASLSREEAKREPQSSTSFNQLSQSTSGYLPATESSKPLSRSKRQALECDLRENSPLVLAKKVEVNSLDSPEAEYMELDYDFDSFLNKSQQTSDTSLRRSSPKPTPKPTLAVQALGLAMGGKLIQDINRDYQSPRLWDTQSAIKINVHFLSPSSCETVTHVVPPPPVMTLKEYLQLGNSFYAVEEDEEARLAGGDFGNILSVGEMDAQKLSESQGAEEGEFDPLIPRPCACGKRLCDCIVRPCGCAWCNVCVRDMGQTCATCGKVVAYVAGFSAPMDLPGEEGRGRFNVPVQVFRKNGKGSLEYGEKVKRRL